MFISGSMFICFCQGQFVTFYNNAANEDLNEQGKTLYWNDLFYKFVCFFFFIQSFASIISIISKQIKTPIIDFISGHIHVLIKLKNMKGGFKYDKKCSYSKMESNTTTHIDSGAQFSTWVTPSRWQCKLTTVTFVNLSRLLKPQLINWVHFWSINLQILFTTEESHSLTTPLALCFWS